jgi:hypothetical protein
VLCNTKIDKGLSKLGYVQTSVLLHGHISNIGEILSELGRAG